MKITRTIQLYKCNKCGHEWVATKKEDKNWIPRMCSKCKSVRWNDPIKVKTKGEQ